MNTIELKIDLVPVSPWSEILIAQLSDLNFDSFVTTNTGVLAYAEEGLNLEDVLSETILNNPEEFTYTKKVTVIEQQNWNASWEENFTPVYIEDFATILAPFHENENEKGMVVRIQPQMSFGTGHHQTTWMMTKALFELENIPTNVLDMGTGTGVLAIFAEKLGAKNILAIDIEEWSAKNAEENCLRNQCENVKCVWGDVDQIGANSFELIIANINKNILKSQMSVYSKQLVTGGKLLLSGFFQTDIDEMLTFCSQHNLELDKTFQKDEWAALQLIKL